MVIIVIIVINDRDSGFSQSEKAKGEGNTGWHHHFKFQGKEPRTKAHSLSLVRASSRCVAEYEIRSPRPPVRTMEHGSYTVRNRNFQSSGAVIIAYEGCRWSPRARLYLG